MVLAADNAFRYHNPYARNEVVKGISLKSLRRRSAIECGLACLDESGCVSFNFAKTEQACELHSKRISDVGKATKEGYRYFELPRSRDGE